MKLCIICNSELKPKARMDKCFKCRRKETCKKWIDNNKDAINEYQKEYRENNRNQCRKRISLSKQKKSEYYRLENLKRYRTKYNIPLDSTFAKNKNGQGHIRSGGYREICIKGHPNSYSEGGKLGEHTYIMSLHLGRPLRRGESVHHKNGVRDDNRIENLELWSKSQPAGQRVEDKIKFYKEFLESYGYKCIDP